MITTSKLFIAVRFLGRFVFVCVVVCIFTWLGGVHIVRAETHITDGSIRVDTEWNASGSPYIIEDPVLVPRGVSLTVGPGTAIIGSQSIEGYPIINAFGTLVLHGEKDDRITFGGYGSVSNSYGTTTIENTDISVSGGLYLAEGLTEISSSTISSSTGYAINAVDSKLHIESSKIRGNAHGISIKPPEQVYEAKRDESGEFGIGGIGNALDGTDEMGVPQYYISNSSLSDNHDTSIYNESSVSVQAPNNWWGSKDGPVVGGTLSDETAGNKIIGPVEYSPWLEKDPFATDTVCCSDILFLPGLEASRLYSDEQLPLNVATITKRYWEPLSETDARSLYLDRDGRSLNPSIYSDDVIDTALYIKGVYGKLIRYLDGLKVAGKVNEWKPFAYDWRRPIDEIVNGREKRATTTESLIDTVTNLAEHSKTGKVTIIAHSNGGLVAKYLVKVLADRGKAELIDKVISVAVPYLGTPKAIPSLLHGADQSIAAGLILREYVARGLGENMSSAYSLLPSSTYFDRVADSVITFASTTINGLNNGLYPSRINDFLGMTSFIVDTKNGRTIASTTGSTMSDTSIAIRGNQSLMNAANNIHSVLDPFVWPPNIVASAVVGWNKSTTNGVAYTERRKCLAGLVGMTCAAKPTHENILTTMGDGTVVVPSATYNDGLVAAVDLKAASTADRLQIDHTSILESSTTLAVLDRMINNVPNPRDVASTSSLSSALASIPAVTVGVPSEYTASTYLVVSTHSPVELHVYDSLGNHTGAITSPNTAIANAGIYVTSEANIPGSSYSSADAGDDHVYLPDDGQKYRLEIRGTGVGEFTLSIERKMGATTLENVEYSVVPVTPLTVAATTIQSGNSLSGNSGGSGGAGGGSITNPPLASSTLPLIIDEDGDGNTDMTVTPNKPFDPITYLELYKKTIKSIAGNTIRGKLLILRIDILESLIKMKKLKWAHDFASRMNSSMDHMRWNKLNTTDKDKILNMFDIFLQQFE